MPEAGWPASMYRVQLRKEFGFEAAAAVVPYLAKLGVTHLYCSPYLQAAPGSTHGYDVVDHSRLNEELGGEAGHAQLVRALEAHGMGHVLDIVPNHMALSGRQNLWWWDVLENGPQSLYADCFDIDWWGPDDKDGPTVLVPVLGDHYGRILDAGELHLVREGGVFLVRYFEHELPLAPRSLDELLSPVVQRTDSPELSQLLERVRALPHAQRSRPDEVRERHRLKEALREQLARLCEEHPDLAQSLDTEAIRLSRNPDAMDALLRRQHYRLAFWRTASEELDYRRFFNIESLVGLRVEDDAVFADSHRKVLELVGSGQVAGLRIDHIDGLRDPAGYLERLRASAPDAYLVVEKILEMDEQLPGDWPVQGTSGYDFLARINALFVDGAEEDAMDRCYARFIDQNEEYAAVVHASKRQVMNQDLRAEVDSLARLLSQICEEHRRHRDHTRRELREALVALLAAFPVYRTYVHPNRAVSPRDRQHVEHALAEARAQRPDLDSELLTFLGALALLEVPGKLETEFALRLSQVSAPVMAKGVEDTAFYRYQRLVSLNEVGGDPAVFGLAPEDVHRRNQRSAAQFPDAMLTLSTHDTKRSGDVRARLNVLSEIPDAWGRAAGQFAEINARHLRNRFPDPHTEYLLYQTLVGAWPLGEDRALAFIEKASREAKIHTSWIDPNEVFDSALAHFVRSILSDSSFLHALETFLSSTRLVELGRLNSLAQTTLLLTCPGVPDVYQGSELWDLSLVDPDNRRTVDYQERTQLLEQVSSGRLPPMSLAEDEVGLHKLTLVARVLAHRRDAAALYRTRHYEPLIATGPKATHVFGFVRERLVVVVPRLVAGLGGTWDEETRVDLPEGSFRDVITGSMVQGGEVEVERLLAGFPVAVLQREAT